MGTVSTTVTVSANVTSTNYTRTGSSGGLTPETITKEVGNFVTDLSIIPYIRPSQIDFKCKEIKPNSLFYAFFDGTDVTARCLGHNVLFLTANAQFRPGETLIGKTSGAMATVITTTANTVILSATENNMLSYQLGKSAAYGIQDAGDFTNRPIFTTSEIVYGKQSNVSATVEYFHFTNVAGFYDGATSVSLYNGSAWDGTTPHSVYGAYDNYLNSNQPMTISCMETGETRLVASYDKTTKLIGLSSAFTVTSSGDNYHFRIGPLNSAQNGVLFGRFFLPKSTFRVGEKVLRLSTDLQNSSGADSFAETKYFAEGLLQNKTSTSISLRNLKFSRENINESLPPVITDVNLGSGAGPATPPSNPVPLPGQTYFGAYEAEIPGNVTLTVTLQNGLLAMGSNVGVTFEVGNYSQLSKTASVSPGTSVTFTTSQWAPNVTAVKWGFQTGGGFSEQAEGNTFTTTVSSNLTVVCKPIFSGTVVGGTLPGEAVLYPPAPSVTSSLSTSQIQAHIPSPAAAPPASNLTITPYIRNFNLLTETGTGIVEVNVIPSGDGTTAQMFAKWYGTTYFTSPSFSLASTDLGRFYELQLGEGFYKKKIQWNVQITVSGATKTCQVVMQTIRPDITGQNPLYDDHSIATSGTIVSGSSAPANSYLKSGLVMKPISMNIQYSNSGLKPGEYVEVDVELKPGSSNPAAAAVYTDNTAQNYYTFTTDGNYNNDFSGTQTKTFTLQYNALLYNYFSRVDVNIIPKYKESAIFSGSKTFTLQIVAARLRNGSGGNTPIPIDGKQVGQAGEKRTVTITY